MLKNLTVKVLKASVLILCCALSVSCARNMSAASVGTAVPAKDGGNTEPSEGSYRQIYLAGGCFWGVQKYMSLIPGIVETESGYANGILENPTYAQVCSGTTGFAETVRVKYDADRISLPRKLRGRSIQDLRLLCGFRGSAR